MPGTHTRHQTHTADLHRKLFCVEVRSHTPNHSLSPLGTPFVDHNLLCDSSQPWDDRAGETLLCCLGFAFLQSLAQKGARQLSLSPPECPGHHSPSESMAALHILRAVTDGHGVPHWVLCRRSNSDPHGDHALV